MAARIQRAPCWARLGRRDSVTSHILRWRRPWTSEAESNNPRRSAAECNQRQSRARRVVYQPWWTRRQEWREGENAQTAAGPSRKGQRRGVTRRPDRTTGRRLSLWGALPAMYEQGRSCSDTCGESALSCPVTSRRVVAELHRLHRLHTPRAMRVISGSAPVAICPPPPQRRCFPGARGTPRDELRKRAKGPVEPQSPSKLGPRHLGIC